MGECAALSEQRPPFERGQALAVSQGEELRVQVSHAVQEYVLCCNTAIHAA